MKQLSQLTEQMLECFVGGGGIAETCGCGRTHVYAHNNEGSFDEGELEGYEAKAKEQPDKYIFHDYSYASSGWLNEQKFVMDCPCLEERFGKYAEFLWTFRHPILDFIRTHHNQLQDRLNMTKASLDTVEHIKP